MSTPPDASTLSLTSADFDAYLPERAGSAPGARRELTGRILAWGRGVAARLAELDLNVDVTASEPGELPCQRVFFWRDQAARDELEGLEAPSSDSKPHAFLALTIDGEHVEVSAEVHAAAWADMRNLRARLDEPVSALELTTALEALPEQFEIGPSATVRTHQAPRVTADQIRTVLDGGSLWIGWSVPRDVAVLHSAVLDEQLEDAIVALGAVFKLIMWARDNDLFLLARELEAQRVDRARARASADPDQHDRAARDAKREAVRRSREKEERPTSRARHEARAEGEPESPVEKKLPTRTLPAVPRALRTLARRASMVTEVDPHQPIDKGTRVRVLAGPFVGKTGVVKALDGKGGARVMLGLLAARVEVKDLIACAEGKDRPALASSHRKPVPVRG